MKDLFKGMRLVHLQQDQSLEEFPPPSFLTTFSAVAGSPLCLTADTGERITVEALKVQVLDVEHWSPVVMSWAPP